MAITRGPQSVTAVSICGALPGPLIFPRDLARAVFLFSAFLLVYLLYLLPGGPGSQNVSLHWSWHPVGAILGTPASRALLEGRGEGGLSLAGELSAGPSLFLFPNPSQAGKRPLYRVARISWEFDFLFWRV